MNKHIAFIGAGNMASALIQGLIGKGYPANKITATSPVEVELAALAKATGINTTTDNQAAAKQADLLVLAVKPQIMQQVCEDLASSLNSETLVLSIAAGTSCAQLTGWLNNSQLALVRAMPNTPALVGAGITGLYSANKLAAAQTKLTEQLIAAVGELVWVTKEEELNSVTAISGSGPAYYFLFTEALAKAGEQLGLAPATALQLAKATAAGAGKLMQTSHHHPSKLREQVTSPGGTTQAALEVFMQEGLEKLVLSAALAANQRAEELSQNN